MTVASTSTTVRLDAELREALGVLTRDGTSQSNAIRSAVLLAAEALRKEQLDAELRAEVERLNASKVNQREVRAVRELMGTTDAW